MEIRHSRNLRSKLSLLVGIIILTGLAISSCTGITTVPRGWSGATMADGILFIASMEGKLVSINASDGNILWAELLKAPETSGGGFGCAPAASTAVAIYGTPAVVEGKDLVCLGGYNGKIYTISPSTRLSKDKYLNEKDREPIIGGPLVAGDTVYVASSDGLVYALDAVSLDEKWNFKTGDKIWSTPAINGDTLFVGSFDKKLYALNAATGMKKWEFATEGAISSTPVVYNNTVYIGSFDRYLYAVDATNGNLKWKFMAGNWFWAKALAYNGVVYAANLDGKVYALDAENGNKLTEFDLGNQISASPVVAGNSIIVATENAVVYALDTETKTQKQLANLREKETDKVQAPLFTDGKAVYIHTSDGKLHALNATSGATLWNISLKTAAPESSSGSTNWGLLIAVAAISIIVVMAISALGRRRKA